MNSAGGQGLARAQLSHDTDREPGYHYEKSNLLLNRRELAGLSGANTVYHMGTISRASKHQTDKNQQVGLQHPWLVWGRNWCDCISGSWQCLWNNQECEESLPLVMEKIGNLSRISYFKLWLLGEFWRTQTWYVKTDLKICGLNLVSIFNSKWLPVWCEATDIIAWMPINSLAYVSYRNQLYVSFNIFYIYYLFI